MGHRRRHPFFCIVLLITAAPHGIGAADQKDAGQSPTPRHWAFEPVTDPTLPSVKHAAWTRTGADRFILAKLEESGLEPDGPAGRCTLIRRLTYDLTGLPPSPGEVDSFVADESPDAYERLVERLLASPRYGERWGRHWLDLVRYADTAGENSDHPVPHAWRYRNWVIRAFNEDKPYDELLREQIAGDILARQGPPEKYADRIVATGFLAIARRFGHDIDKDMHLTIEDTIDTLGKSVLGLTIGCARCHDHKYDPMTQRDYYGLYGILASTRFSFPGCEPKQMPRDLVPLLRPDEIATRQRPIDEEMAPVAAEVKRVEDELSARRREVNSPVLEMIASGELAPNGSQEFTTERRPAAGGALHVRRGEMLRLSVLPRANHGADSTGVEWEIAERGGEGRVWSLTRDMLRGFQGDGQAAQMGDSYGVKSVWHFFDLVPSPTLFTNLVRDAEKTPGLDVWRGVSDTPSAFVNRNEQTIRFISITMPARSLGLHPGPRGGVAAAWESPVEGEVTVRLRLAKIDPGGDGIAWTLERRPGIGPALAAQRSALERLASAAKRRIEIESRRPAIPVAYAVAEGAPSNARIQKRGDPSDPGDEVPRKFLDVLGGQVLPREERGSGRIELAEWIASSSNPLTARVIANRVWQHHMNRPLAGTPNDFGRRGQPPTHPELLDHLAALLVKSGWSLKALHREIVLSATYRLSPGASAASVGSDLYPRFARRRLDAEEIRDTLLAANGDLDLTPGEVHPFPPESTWAFTQHGPFSAVYESSHRSVYLMTQRIRRHPILALFDGPDPNASTPVRDVTTVPAQALFFLNDPFVHARALAIARRVMASSPDDAERIRFTWRLLLSREVSEPERDDALELLRAYAEACETEAPEIRAESAWAAQVRVLLGSNEFLYVD